MKRELLKEERRLLRLHQYHVLDSEAEKAFDDLAVLAAEICGVPFSGISLLDRERQWFKARFGLTFSELMREDSICSHAIMNSDLFLVEDATKDSRFNKFPSVKSFPNIRFYAAIPLITSDGHAIGTLCVMDTRVRTLNEIQKFSLKTLAAQIMTLLELRLQNFKLEASQQEAEKAVQAKSEFLSQMSHELRTPLNGILGMVHWLIQDNLRAEQLEMVNTLKFSAENLLCLINDILDYNKLQAKKLSLEKIDFNLVEILRQLEKSFSIMAKQKGITLKSKFGENLPLVKGDPLRLFQVLNNLLGNAIKFTSEGKVVLEVFPVMETENYITLRFSVMDTGIGIPLEKQELIFEEFSQATIDVSRKFGGTGLGLTITRNLVRLMEGDITVCSEPGKGSEFVFSISFQKCGPSKQIQEQAFTTAGIGFIGKTVLLVEDNEINKIVASKFLDRWGMKVMIASNGREAVNMTMEEKFDLILMDLHMPLMDGFEATRQIRTSAGYNKNVPIIAITASAVLEVKQEAFAAGVSGYLLKPFKPGSLYNIIYKHLSGSVDELPYKELAALVDEMSEGDEVFKKELVNLYIKSFRGILDELNAGILQDSENLRRARHKHKSTFRLMNLTTFEEAFLRLQTLVDAADQDEEAVHQEITCINHLGEQLICSLEAIADIQ